MNVDLPVSFTVSTCEHCKRPYAVVSSLPTLCPYCAADILASDHQKHASAKAEMRRLIDILHRSIRSYKGVITRLKKGTVAKKVKEVKQEPAVDLSDPANYEAVQTDQKCSCNSSLCDYIHLNANMCPSERGFDFCVARDGKTLNLKKEHLAQLTQEQHDLLQR